MTELPEVVGTYQDAHDRHDTDAALATFAADAHVSDDGHDYRGRDEIRDWLSRASVEFTYATLRIPGWSHPEPERLPAEHGTSQDVTSRGRVRLPLVGTPDRRDLPNDSRASDCRGLLAA